jgi:uncharacterized membrane protein YeaQ/YmgE (transglycosylase-associated protein family)
MPRIRTLFLLLMIIGPLHMAEQMLTAIDEFYSIRDLIGGYYAWFDPAAADHASVLLVTIVWTLVSVLFYTLLHDGPTRLIVPAFFGLFGATEAHHVIESLLKGAYDPGVVMSVPYAIVGAMLVAAVWREFKREVTTTDTTFATAHR